MSGTALPLRRSIFSEGIREMYKSEHKGESSHLAIFKLYFWNGYLEERQCP